VSLVRTPRPPHQPTAYRARSPACTRASVCAHVLMRSWCAWGASCRPLCGLPCS